MPSKQEVIARIAAALQEKTGGQHPCQICGKRQWAFSGEFVAMPASNNPLHIHIGGPVLPLMPIVCTNCGNTSFINLLVLGFKDSLNDLQIDKDEPAKP